MRLRMPDPKIEAYIDSICPPGIEPDRRFAYHLLGAHNICVVPLTSFVSKLSGFRVTLLERDDANFQHIYTTIARAIQEFLASG